MTAHSWRIEAAGATHPGQRSHNEDSWRADEENSFFMVADGVGGRDAGEVASRIACEVTGDEVRAGAGLAPALGVANAAIRDAIATSGERASSMASTAVALHLQPQAQWFSVAWAGDSRLYLWDGQLKMLTRDHSLVESLLRRGEISRAEADDHPRRNVILTALGDTEAELESGENGGPLPGKALFLLCSDGLSDIVSSGVLCETLARDGDSLQMRAEALVQAAVDDGGRDNITAVLVSWQYADGVQSPASPGNDGPVVYEVFDPVSGERRRNVDEDRVAPTTRRVPARSEDTGTGRARQIMEIEARLITDDGNGHPLVETLTVGRSNDCDITLSSRRVSRRHARFRVSNGGVTIEDLESSNGTRLNGRAIESAQALVDGDQVSIDTFTLTVVIASPTTGETSDDATIITPPAAEDATVRTAAVKEPPAALKAVAASGSRLPLYVGGAIVAAALVIAAVLFL